MNSIQNALADDVPFHHLRFERVFPDDFYAEMLEAMPGPADYRAMSGKSKTGSSRPDGKPTRSKIDLFPEYIHDLPPKKREVWDVAGCALCSRGGGSVRAATRAGLEAPIRYKLCKGGNVSCADPDSRHFGISHR